jgi:hypothetical protein
MPAKGTLPRGWRPSKRQQRYRQKIAGQRWNSGYTTVQIAEAFKPQVNDATIRNDLNIALGAGTRTKRIVPTLPDPPPVNWLEPPADEGGSIERDPIAALFRQLISDLTEMRWGSAHGNGILAARRAGDWEWLDGWEALLGRLQKVVDQLGEMHGENSAAEVRAAIRGWGDESLAQLDHGDAERAAAAGRPSRGTTAPPGLIRAVRDRVERGQPISRAMLAAKYGVGDHVVQAVHQRERARHETITELMELGWGPPPATVTALRTATEKDSATVSRCSPAGTGTGSATEKGWG